MEDTGVFTEGFTPDGVFGRMPNQCGFNQLNNREKFLENNKCLNCGLPVSQAYCPACGQATSISRMNVREVLTSAAGHFFSLDAVVPRTVLDLTRNPGQVASRYVDGHRVAYVAPFRYCLTAVALLMLAYALVGRNTDYFVFNSGRDLSPTMLKFQAETMSFVLRHLNTIIFAALPLQALLLKGLFRHSRFNYAEVTSFTLYIMGHSFLLASVLAVALYFATDWQFVFRFVLQTGYLVWAAIVFFGENRLRTALKCILANILNMFIVALLVVILLIPKFSSLVKEIKAEKAQATTTSLERASNSGL